VTLKKASQIDHIKGESIEPLSLKILPWTSKSLDKKPLRYFEYFAVKERTRKNETFKPNSYLIFFRLVKYLLLQPLQVKRFIDEESRFSKTYSV
jgi:hypothetical protein